MSELLLTCEHASPDVPEGLDLGVSHEVLTSHIGFDRGARELAMALAAATGAPLHLGRWSRLVVDLNRREGNPAVIVEESSGVRIPGNTALSPAAWTERISLWHRPYREAAREDAMRVAGAGGCLHLAIHAFEPRLDPEARAFDVGVLLDPSRSPERELASALADSLRRAGWDARLDEPYRGTPEGLTSWLRGQIPAAHYTGFEIEASYAVSGAPERRKALARDLATCAELLTSL